MLEKYFHIENDRVRKNLAILVILFLVSYKLFFYFLLINIVYFLLFRKTDTIIEETQGISNSIAVSPINGTFKGEEIRNGKKIIVINTLFTDSYGVIFPYSGVVDRYFSKRRDYKFFSYLKLQSYKVQVSFKSKTGLEMKLKFKSLTFIRRAEIWVRSGDKGSRGAYIGYAPFGGTVLIETSPDVQVMVSPGDRVQMGKTILLNKKED